MYRVSYYIIKPDVNVEYLEMLKLQHHQYRFFKKITQKKLLSSKIFVKFESSAQKVSPKLITLGFLMPVEKSSTTAILGAGITGLCIAHALRKSGQKCHIIESSDRVGGALQSTQEHGFLAEHGPNSLLLKDRRVLELLEQINLGGSHIQDARPEAHNRFIVHQGKLCKMPHTPLNMLRSPLFSLGGALRVAREPLIGRYQGEQEESFADFVRRRLGREILESAAGPFVSGIYAGDPERLSIRYAFPRLWKLENTHRSLLLGALKMRKDKHKDTHTTSPTRTISFRDGLAMLPRALAQNLSEGELKLQTNITHITPLDGGWKLTWTTSQGNQESHLYSRLIITVPHHRISTLPLPSDVIQQLTPVSAIESPPVTSRVFGFKREQVEHPLDGFGMLIKAAEKSPLLGVLFSSSMFDHRAPNGHITLTCMMGGVKNPQYAENTDQVVLDELKKLLGVRGTPTFRHSTSWQHAIPQYNIGYSKVLNALKDCESSHPGLHFAGNYRNGISVTDCIINGLNLGHHLGHYKKSP